MSRLDEYDLFVHAAGYSTIAFVLASADWASFVSWVLVIPMVLGTLGYGGLLAFRAVIERARALESSSAQLEATASE